MTTLIGKFGRLHGLFEMKRTGLIVCYVVALLLFGCSAPKQVELASGTSPKTAIFQATRLMEEAGSAQSDLLSFKEHSSGTRYLKNAVQELSGGGDYESILSYAAIAKAHFIKALKESKAKSPNATRILQARKSSLDADVKSIGELSAALADIDDDLRDETKNFSKALEPVEFSEFQKRYFSLEVKAVQFRELQAVRKIITDANENKAKDLASETLRTALLDLSEAENTIAQSPRNPEIHRESVDVAIASSALLSEVMNIILNAKGTPENIALKIVKQDSALGEMEEALKSTESILMEKEDALKIQNEELELQLRFQLAVNEVVKIFSNDEASVYQQGTKLIFRLKRINFESGTSVVPPRSKPLLLKINDVIKLLGTESVVVQGHSDSVGRDDYNKDLSTDRAIAVAAFLLSLEGGYRLTYIGYGESQPIASNDTALGRATNRRVDLVVTAVRRGLNQSTVNSN